MTPLDPGQSDVTAARLAVELAMSFDRTATRLVQSADLQLDAANADFETSLSGRTMGADLPSLTNSLQIAIGARQFAAEYQLRCRENLASSLDTFAAVVPFSERTRPDTDPVFSTSAADVILSEATAIAAAAEASLAAELHASTVLAETRARDAVRAAAETVSAAAEAARAARAVADKVAADEIAATALSTASRVQRRADELAVAVSAAASNAASALPAPQGAKATLAADRVAALVAATATSKAHETALAAAIVAEAVTHAAAVVAVTAAAAAAATEQDVRHAAAAVQAMAGRTAADLVETARRNMPAVPDLPPHRHVGSATA